MGKEIEAKFFIDNKDDIRKKLCNVGLKLKSKEHLMKRKCFHTDNNGNGVWIRVRDEGNKITMTYKKVVENNINGIEEIELVVDNFDNACEFISKTDFFEVSYQETLREVWENEEVEIVIDTWPCLQNYIEIEARNEEIVKKYAKLLNFDFDKEAFFGGVAVLYEKQYSIPQNVVNNIPLIKFDDNELQNMLNNYKK